MTDPAKLAAAKHAADLVEDGMTLGLGSGSTAALFVQALGVRVRAGLRVTGVPTSESTAALAKSEGIALATIDACAQLDMDVDGADAVDPKLDMVKGLGGALLREKIVAAASRKLVIIVGEDKLVEKLSRAPVIPIEVVQFGRSHTERALGTLGATATLRMRKDRAGEAFVTDGGNHILDCRFGDYDDAVALATRIKSVTGVVEHGLFVAMADEVVVASGEGRIRVLKRHRA